MIITVTNKSKNFYTHLGPVFGSRKVQRITGDRFYDDDDKVWYLYYDKGSPSVFISISDGVIKNVWGENDDLLSKTLREVREKENIKESIVPRIFEKQYREAGYKIISNGYTNFIKIRSGKHE